MPPPFCAAAATAVVLTALTVGCMACRDRAPEPTESGETIDATLAITAGADGGDCRRLGSWDAAALTCTVSRSPARGVGIRIDGDGITLDGDGHALRGDGSVDAVRIFRKQGVTVQNLTISGYRDGIVLRETRSSRVRNVVVSDSLRHGLYLTGSSANLIENNRIGPTASNGINLIEADGNLILGNCVVEARDALRLQDSVGNVVAENHFADNRIEALDLHRSRRNRLFFNNYVTSAEITVFSDLGASANDYSISAGGSHYSGYDEPAEGCMDANADGFCDEPYRFRGGEDPLPFVREHGWLAIPATGSGRCAPLAAVDGHPGE